MTPEERAEQRNDEILALESVYENELIISNESEYPVINIFISAFAKSKPEIAFKISLQCNYDDDYPVSRLNAFIKYNENCKLNDRSKAKLELVLNDELNGGVGSLVVYNVASALQDSLQYIADHISKEDEIEALERKIREEEEHKRRFIGTAVTPESFLSWKIKFNKEMELSKNKEIEEINKNMKLTGKELFLQDSHLNVSDLDFLKDELEEGEMEIDESLFDINDLDLEDLSD